MTAEWVSLANAKQRKGRAGRCVSSQRGFVDVFITRTHYGLVPPGMQSNLGGLVFLLFVISALCQSSPACLSAHYFLPPICKH